MNNQLMKAVICTAYGTPDVLKIVHTNKPVVKSGQIRVKIMSTAVNSGDVRVRSLNVNWWQRILMRVLIGFTKPRKAILGTVYAGVVEAVGEKVNGFAAGDEVFGLTGFNFGTCSEYIAVNAAGVVLHKPANTTFDEAAAVLFGGQTALYFLQKAGLDKGRGKKVMIYGASGAVGAAAVQVAKYYGARVTAVCSAANRELVKSLGADEVICYDREDFTHTGNRFDVVFDAVGKITSRQCAALLKTGGAFFTVGGNDYARERKEQLVILREMCEKGRLKAVIDKVFAMDDVAEAHRYVDTGRKKGNVVLRIASV
ncbi:MAG: NAD(P)-dependent alcohol dehydrogenase [Bacteroidia bacterium]|jgi:NADPH:quinone reductase-like Zn-dependent oxidoreductase|nr:NAD(P)-dependent alcohol dehydrogenase [Bacteroidia bacterium]